MVAENNNPAPADRPPAKPKSRLLAMFDRDFWRTVTGGVLVVVLAAVIIGLPAFISQLASQLTLDVKTLKDIVSAINVANRAALEVIERGQILLAGIFLCGILYFVVTFNAERALYRADREAYRRRNSMAAALQEEIRYLGIICGGKEDQIAEALLERAEDANPMPGHGWNQFKVSGMTIYEANGAHIGLLPSPVAAEVVRFYTVLAAYNNAVSGGGIDMDRRTEMEAAANFAKDATVALQNVIDGKYDT